MPSGKKESETFVRAIQVECRYCQNDVKVYHIVGTDYRYYCGLCDRYFWYV